MTGEEHEPAGVIHPAEYHGPDAWERMARAVEHIRQAMIDAGVIPAPVPTDPRGRALHLRKHRNTGPGKPAQEQRRKRR